MDDGGGMDFSDLCLLDFDNDCFLAGGGTAAEHHRTCTHTHICVPPVDVDAGDSHTHACVHVHAHAHATTVPPPPPPPPDAAGSSRKLPSASCTGKAGNRVAVRKYRAKKKAQAASLEQQLDQLKALSQELTARVAKLEAEKLARERELARLRYLLREFKGRIELEIGAAADAPLPYGQIPVQRPAGITMQGGSSRGHQVVCDAANIQCFGIGSTNLPACGGMDAGTGSPAAAAGGGGGCIPNVGKN